MRSFVHQLRCTICGTIDSPESGDATCARCGVIGIREVEFDYDAIRRVMSPASLAADGRRNILRYRPLLPIGDVHHAPPLTLPNTPVDESPRLAEILGLKRLWIKNDGLLPTGSLKDRASFIAVARARQQGRTAIAAASTGNAATSLAGLSAAAGLVAHIFVPASAPEAKIAQLAVYGVRLFLVRASYDVTYDLCQQAVARFGWYDRSAAVNPYLVEGKKTCGHEIAEHFTETSTPDWVAMSVGDGCSIAGAYKGLVEMKTLGVIDRVPRMLAVQARGAAPLCKAFREGTEIVERIDDAYTLADSINVGMPRNPLKALRAVRASGGAFVDVEDEAMLDWLPRVARLSGVFAEPTAIAAIAGVDAAKTRGIIQPNETVIAVMTGHGLKDVKTAMRAVKVPPSIEPTLDAVESML